MIEMDATDRRILTVLQRDGRKTNSDLAAEVGLSPSACHRRVQRLEDLGVIRGYVALLDARKLERPTTVFVEITLSGQADEILEEFEREDLARALKLPPIATPAPNAIIVSLPTLHSDQAKAWWKLWKRDLRYFSSSPRLSRSFCPSTRRRATSELSRVLKVSIRRWRSSSLLGSSVNHSPG